jgi:hypothetical protein
LTSSEIKAALEGVDVAAKACAHGADPAPAAVRVQLAVSGLGTVMRSTPLGPHAGTDLGRCVAEAPALAKFPRFKKSTIGVVWSVRFDAPG